jgi:hypothetical protein
MSSKTAMLPGHTDTNPFGAATLSTQIAALLISFYLLIFKQKDKRENDILGDN